jgi:hypothetical protein
MPAEKPPAISTFRGDFEQLAGMMQRSWSGNQEQPLLYSNAFLESAFAYPGSSFDLAPAMYAGDTLLAFAAGFPRSMRLEGRQIRLLLKSFLTASAEVKRAGYGLVMWKELMRRARAAGYDGTVEFCVEGDDMNRMLLAAARLFQFNTQRVYAVEFLSRFLRPAPAEPPLPEVAERDIEMFLDLTAGVAAPLARCWMREEAIWQCQRREGAVVANATHGPRRGMLTGHIMPVASTPPARAVLMEDLLWGDLEPGERGDLLQRFLRAAASRGAQAASCPVLGCFSTEPLAAAGFRRAKRVLHTYLTLWNGPQPGVMPSLYIDVF